MPPRSPLLVVTGGSRGIGAATAPLAAERGYNVAVVFRDQLEAAEAVAEQCRTLGRRAAAFRADVADQDEIVAPFAAVDQHLGSIDALVTSAGVESPQARVATLHGRARPTGLGGQRCQIDPVRTRGHPSHVHCARR